ncbi:Transcription factor WhiB [Agreia bicolorata]|uniref:Transcription factor WhiB n=1 Tax=Agreia bicolorata TaxID=110935 RepID=A0A1T4XBF0_9MICO|nr:WhiB family transcriptional regulator [Agreia bicolorata]SKA87012.1 Transcription factor WhiB [Agreia bicolorata]
MSRATEAYKRLHHAMQESEPSCINDDRFILDDQPAHTLSYICRKCPVFDLCREYAEAERPKGGTWAGRSYRTTQSRQNKQ